MSEINLLDFSEQSRRFVRLLQSRQWTILTFLSVMLLMVLVSTSLETPLYRASTTVLIDMETPNVVGVSTQSASSRDDYTRADIAQTNYMTYADYYRTQVATIRSRAIAERVFDNLKLGNLKQYARAKDPIRNLLNQVSVQPVKQTRLAQILVEDPNPKLAADIANEFGLVFAEQNLTKEATEESMTLMKNQYLKLQARESELSKRYKDKFPAMVRVHQQMEHLTRSIEREMKKQLQAETSRPDVSKSVVESLRRTSTIEGLRPNNIRVQDLAETPLKPYKPRVMLNLFLGVFFGLLGGFGTAVVQELLDNSLKLPEDIERDSRFVLLGHIPEVEEMGASPLDSSPEFTHSPGAEAYRSLRTNLLYTIPHGNARTLVVTSPGSEEGKTTTATQLGIALAQIGMRVLLIDADMRKPRLHQIFQLQQKPGLSEFLNSKAGLEKVIQPSGISNVWVITSGAIPPNPSELLGMPQMKELIRHATAKFDRVLLDSPPVIPVTDAMVLGAITGTVLAVAQSGKTPKQALVRLYAVMNDVQAKVLGVVLNKVPSRNIFGYGYGPTAYRYGDYGNSPQGEGQNNIVSNLIHHDHVQNAVTHLTRILTRVYENSYQMILQMQKKKGVRPDRPVKRDVKGR